MELAAGILPSAEAGRMLEDAAHCDCCGQILKSSVEDFQDDEAATFLADPAFPGRMAASLMKHSRPNRFPAAWSWAAAAVLALAIASTGYWLMRERDPGTMLARAAAAHRMLPIRIPDAPYSPLDVQRSANTGTPAMLAEAEALILRNLERDPGNVRWLRYKSRVELLRGRYRASLSTLSTDTNAPEFRAAILVDLGTAWLAQGLASQRTDELQRALGYLSEALDREPANSVARFNRAIAAERLSLLDSAETDWRLFIDSDCNSGWAGEARANLERVRQKKTVGATP
jgi:tetratricopeptide (TPR) repeat protein